MAIHAIPDNDPGYMSKTHGTVYLITDPKSEIYLQNARRKQLAKLKESKTITDAWTI